jgi:hypothetical protein
MGLRKRDVIRIFAAASIALPGIVVSPAAAQKSGGTLRIYNTTQPPSASIHEESTIATNMPFMAIFNNLVLFDHQAAQRLRHHRAGAGGELGLGRVRHQADGKVALRRHLA